MTGFNLLAVTGTEVIVGNCGRVGMVAGWNLL